jgi:DNA replication protein DnaD
MEDKTSALNFTVWDLTGAPLSPKEADKLIAFVQQFAIDNKLVCQVVEA